MKLFRWLTSSFAGLMLVSCVTINIYFPAAAAEKAADRIIEDVWGPAEVSQPKNKEDNGVEQQSLNTPSQTQQVAIRVLDWFISPAAAEVNINVSSPAINAIQTKMKQRHNSLKPYYNSGAIGLTENGLIVIHNAKAIALKDRNKVNSLVADENNDRKALYAEIARANGHPEWQADIQSTFARRWVGNANKGWWYQSAGKWLQK